MRSQDTQWNDIDYMHTWYDWTYDTDKFAALPDIVKDLHDHGQHYIMIVVGSVGYRLLLEIEAKYY